jgi:leucyl-tRNA synthetase
MELVNLATSATTEPINSSVQKATLETILTLLFPMVPHFCEELWSISGHSQQLHFSNWPTYNVDAAKEEELTIVVQMNGKVRVKLQVAPDIEDADLQHLALTDDKIVKMMDGKQPRKVIVVKKKLVNIVL